MKPSKLFILVSTALVGLALLLAIYKLPLAKEVRQLSLTDLTLETHVLLPGKSIQETFVTTRPILSGIRIFTTTPALTNQRLQVTLSDKSGAILATGQLSSQSYLPADDTIVQDYTFPWLATKPKELLTVSLQLITGESIPIRMSILDTYGKGNLYIEGEVQEGDMAMATIHPAELSFGAKTGATFGVAFFILTSLIATIVPSKWRWPAAAALVFLITPLALLGFWFSTADLGIADWDLYFSYHEVLRRTILVYHTFPFWNPWLCGGTAALADPEFPLFTLTFLVEFIFGIPAGMRLAIYLSVATTALGMLVLARRLKLSLMAALVAALAGAFGSVTILELVEGHPNVFAAMWIPWIFWAWRAAYAANAKTQITKHKQNTNYKAQIYNHVLGSNVWSLVCGGFLALAFYAGGIYLLMYTALAFIFITFLVSRPLAAIKTTTVAGLWGLGFASLKLIPVLMWLRQFQDESYASSASTFQFLDEIFFGRHLHGSNIIFDQTSGWHEYGAYIGYFVFALALIGLSQFFRNRIVRALAIAALAATLLSTAGPALEPYFDQWPFLPRSNISRFVLFAVIPLSLLAAYGLDRLTAMLRKAVTRPTGQKQSMLANLTLFLPIFLVGFIAIDLFSLSFQLSEQAFVLPDIINKPSPAPYPIAYTAHRYDANGAESRTTRSYAAIREGYGTLTYCSVLGPKPSIRTIHDEEDNGIIIVRPQPEHIELAEWTPNRITFNLANSQPTRLVLNANYAEGWRANGQPTIEKEGRVTTSIPPGENIVTFEYKTSGFALGLTITLITLVLALLSIYYKYKRS